MLTHPGVPQRWTAPAASRWLPSQHCGPALGWASGSGVNSCSQARWHALATGLLQASMRSHHMHAPCWPAHKLN